MTALEHCKHKNNEIKIVGLATAGMDINTLSIQKERQVGQKLQLTRHSLEVCSYFSGLSIAIYI